MNRELLETFGLDPDVVHLNHGSYGCAPIRVRQAAERWRDRAERNPHRFNGRELLGLVGQARQRGAEFLGVEPDSVGLVRNVSEGVSSVLGSLDLAAGDEIVLCNHGYGAVRIAAESWAGRRGATVKIAEFDLGATDQEIVAAFTDRCGPRTRLVVVDQITAPTATVLPVAAVAAAVDAPVLADAAHVPGTLPTDIAGLGVAYWIGNLHKWAYTPRGTALLWTRPDLRDRTYPATLNWMLNDGYSVGFDHPGTWDYAGWLALGDGLDFWAELGGWAQVDRQSDLVGAAQRHLAETFGTELDGITDSPAPTMRMVRLPGGSAATLGEVKIISGRLAEEHAIEAAVGFHGTPMIRLAAAPYNTADDYDRLAEAVGKLIAG
ncbi:aminotransferase class V-fold PLP-dependent enzyme [Microlunatus speluncae]|uniref:aminotransferase class V-fold PLP-dependent enzyme n=1 Tax=Microlunatus speluncae TaxID=2594267 RepID=UPI0013754441|nr:aminotransferase class V-fold PLP-dependent enzyme [Microlunatus speluncae]